MTLSREQLRAQTFVSMLSYERELASIVISETFVAY